MTALWGQVLVFRWQLCGDRYWCLDDNSVGRGTGVSMTTLWGQVLVLRWQLCGDRYWSLYDNSVGTDTSVYLESLICTHFNNNVIQGMCVHKFDCAATPIKCRLILCNWTLIHVYCIQNIKIAQRINISKKQRHSESITFSMICK